MQFIGSLLYIKPGEGRMAGYFITLFVLIGTGIALAKGSADALFLKRYGVENLAWVYIGLSVTLAIVCTVYAAYVERMSSERLLKIIFSLQLLLLCSAWFSMTALELELVYPGYYALYSLSSEMMLVHGAFYLGQNLDTLQAKRLMPVVMGGYQLGMIGGGVLLLLVIPQVGLDIAPLIWAVFTMLSLGMLLIWHRRHGNSPFYYPKGRSGQHKFRTAMDEIARGLEFTRQNRLLRNASWALILLVITFYMMSYCAHVIYAETFESEQNLAGFFGALLIGSYTAAVLLQMFVSNRVIDFLGVRRTKLIYAVTTIASFVFLLLHPGFFAALFASINRETIMPAFRNPARQLFFNVLPEYMKGRARAISIAVVMPLALLTCGGLILFMQRFGSVQVIAFAGLLLSFAYLFYCLRMGREYVATLIQSMREKLYLPNEMVRHYHDTSPELLEELVKGLASEDDEVSLSYARALVLSFPDESVGYILERLASAEVDFADQMIRLVDAKIDKPSADRLRAVMHKGDDHLRATVTAAILRADSATLEGMIHDVLKDPSPRVRCAGVRAAVCSRSEALVDRGLHAWHELLMGSDRDKRSCAELIDLIPQLNEDQRSDLLSRTRNVITQIMAVAGERRRIQLYSHLNNWQWPLPEVVCRVLKQDVSHPDPAVRAAAVRCAHVLQNRETLFQYIWQGLDDGHMRVRRAALDLIGDLYGTRHVYVDMLGSARMATPRALAALLEKAIDTGVTQQELRAIVLDKTAYAAAMLSAARTIDTIEQDLPSLLVLKHAMKERYNQLVDLVLLGLSPVVESGDITVIREALKTSDPRYRADAMEALQSLDDIGLPDQLVDLVGGDDRHMLKTGALRAFSGIEEVLDWCINETDQWLAQCARKTGSELAGASGHG